MGNICEENDRIKIFSAYIMRTVNDQIVFDWFNETFAQYDDDSYLRTTIYSTPHHVHEYESVEIVPRFDKYSEEYKNEMIRKLNKGFGDNK